MSPKLLAMTQRLLTNRRHPISQPNVRSTIHRFLSNTKHDCLFRSQYHLYNPTANIHDPHHEWHPVKPTINPNRRQPGGCFAHAFDSLEDSFAAFTLPHMGCCDEHPRILTPRYPHFNCRLRPLISLPLSNPIDSCTPAALLTL